MKVNITKAYLIKDHTYRRRLRINGIPNKKPTHIGKLRNRLKEYFKVDRVHFEYERR